MDRAYWHAGEPSQAIDRLGFLNELHHAEPQAFPLRQRDRLGAAGPLPNLLLPAPMPLVSPIPPVASLSHASDRYGRHNQIGRERD